MERITFQEKSTGAKNIFTAYPIGTVKSFPQKGESVLTIKSKYKEGLKGLEKFGKILIIYYKGSLNVEIGEVKKIEGNKIHLRYSKSLDDAEILDIKPSFEELDF